jgi:pimeloyl-ACP methyl ester carboxylesterase
MTYTETVVNIPVRSHTLGGILTTPSASASTNTGAVNELALIIHGFGGHKDYIYQRQLARELPITSLRFDFSSCGDSSITDPTEFTADPGANQGQGATYYFRGCQSDLDDFGAILAWLAKPQPDGTRYTLTTLIGHSRGALLMMHWAAQLLRAHPPTVSTNDGLFEQKNPPLVNLKYIVNCASRYQTHLIIPNFERNFPGFLTNRGGNARNVRQANGAYGDIWVSIAEIEDLAFNVPILKDIETIKLTPGLKLLSIYGLEDRIVPLDDAYSYEKFFANVDANNNTALHRLVIIPEADHNYYGPPKIAGEKRSNYNPIVIETILEFLQH